MITTADASAKSSAASVTRLAAGTLHMRWSIVIAQTVTAQSKQPLRSRRHFGTSRGVFSSVVLALITGDC